MRRTVANNARSAFSASRQDLASRATFICASCRRTAQRRAQGQHRITQRPFSTSIHNSQQASTASAEQPQRESIAPQTHYDLFPKTFPNGPPPKSPFIPDLRQLRREFLELQGNTHPDRAAQSQKRQAEALSARVNEAYKTIQDPLRRARYLLSLRGIDVEDDSAKLEENELLMEVMEVREAVEEAENEEQLLEIREKNNGRIDASVKVLSEAFEGGDMEKAAQEAVRLRYYTNIEESIAGWEKGKGGGILHH